ncbi:MAG: uncharacterized membrane protein YidH (DUF202 family) [Cryomorphaceae bacterium]|jgi:uncharacterized membrane protein YidH (DUF202 family)
MLLCLIRPWFHSIKLPYDQKNQTMETIESPTQKTADEPQWLDSAQLLLSEKRTSLSFLRAGVGIFVLPLSVLSLLIATAKTYEFNKVMELMIPVLSVSALLTVLAGTLIIRSLIELQNHDKCSAI